MVLKMSGLVRDFDQCFVFDVSFLCEFDSFKMIDMNCEYGSLKDRFDIVLNWCEKEFVVIWIICNFKGFDYIFVL